MSHSLNQYLSENRDRFERELAEFLAIPSVSTESRYSKDVERCAKWLAGHIESAGVATVEVIPTAGKPFVVPGGTLGFSSLRGDRARRKGVRAWIER
jgi:acetylornithine deacetylase/succinyl-diaminopimelate desuccinylase-like protein